MHILHVYKDYFPVLGGMENHLRILSEGLVERGQRVTVLVSNTRPTTVIEQRNGVVVIKAAEWLRRASTPISPSMLWHSWNIKPDLIHLHHPFPPGDLVYWTQRRRPPLVITHQSDIVRQQRLLKLYRPLLQRTLAAADQIIATSPQYIQSSPWLQPLAAKCTVVPLSVDAERFNSPDPQRTSALKQRFGPDAILFVGRLRYYKGLHFLVEALTLLPASAKLVMVGIGPEEARLRSLANELNVADRIIWAGEVDDAELPNYYASTSVFVLPAHLRSEAFGIVQLEALAAGLPIVSTELGTGTSYVNQHGKTGFVVPPANPQALAQAIHVLLANPTLRAHFSAAGQLRARQEFTPELMIERVLAIYQRLVQPVPSDMVS